MAYGIQIQNTNNIVQIDQDYKNYCLTQSGSVTSTTAGVTVTFTTVSGTIPIVAIANVPSGNYILLTAISATSFTVSSASTTTFNYKVYSLVDATTLASGFGLRVFNSSSQCVFDSLKTYLRIRYVTNFLANSITAGVFASASSTASIKTINTGIPNGYLILNGTYGTTALYSDGTFGRYLGLGMGMRSTGILEMDDRTLSPQFQLPAFVEFRYSIRMTCAVGI